MRTLVIDAPVDLVRRTLFHLESPRVVFGRGKTWVQSPDLDRMERGELLRLARAAGLVVELLEDQDPLPEGTEAG